MKLEPMTDEQIIDIAKNPITCPCSPWWLKGDVVLGDVRAAAKAYAHAIIAARDAQWHAAIIADREKRAQAAQPHAYAVYFPDQQREELVHDLDELLDDLTNYEHTVTPLFATEASKPVQACDHQYHYFGDQQKRRRCNRCNELEPVQAEAPTASNELEGKQGANHEKESCDGQINPSPQNHGWPDPSRACTDGWAGEDQCDQHRAGNADPQREDDQRARQCDGLRGACDFSAQEPYGQVTTHSVTGQQFFYRWPQPPYLDNASECVTVYAALATQQEAQPQADPLHLSRILHEMAGAVSMCWEPRPTGVFDSQKAIEFVAAAIAEIRARAAQADPAGGDKEDADKYRLIRRGQHWSVIDGIGNTLRGDGLDAAVDAIRAAQQATGERG